LSHRIIDIALASALAWHEQVTLLGFYLRRPECLPLAWRNQCTVLGLAFARSASSSHRRHRRCGTGIWPARDIAARRRHMTAPRPSLPSALPAPPRTPAPKARLFDVGGEYPARHGLSAGGEWIRTSSSARDRQRFRGFGRVGADRPSAPRYHPRRRRPRQIDSCSGSPGVIVHRRM
jgi:hypothetical protein